MDDQSLNFKIGAQVILIEVKTTAIIDGENAVHLVIVTLPEAWYNWYHTIAQQHTRSHTLMPQQQHLIHEGKCL